MVKTYKVPGIKCEGCASTIQKALAGLSGLQAAQVSVPAKEVRVEFDPTHLGEGEIGRALTAAGFPPTSSETRPAP